MAVHRLVEHYCDLPRVFRQSLWRFLHLLLMRFDSDESSLFLNYGFAEGNGEPEAPEVASVDPGHRSAVRLYHRVTWGVRLENTHVLEVGCGRGGGAAFLARRFRPSEYVGMDISAMTTAFCNRFYRVPGLSFVQGSSEEIPFPDARFDVVVNIESSRCYGDIGAFFREVFRVLRPGGHFLFADMFRNGDLGASRRLLSRTGFETNRAEDIRENVICALRADSPARKDLIDARVPPFLRRGFYELSGLMGSDRFRSFVNGDFQYWAFSLRKPGTTGRPGAEAPGRPGEGETP